MQHHDFATTGGGGRQSMRKQLRETEENKLQHQHLSTPAPQHAYIINFTIQTPFCKN